MDNAIIAQELIHSMSNKKDRVGVMAIKIDLEKAYDCIEWSFIRDTLALFKFSKHLISLIMNYVSSSSISVLFNGALIIEKCKANLWDPITASRGGIAFSHIFFADDLMLFAKEDRKNCMAVRDALDTFFALSGQKISNEQSRVFFSPNV
ncbi:uncharacterized protein LOC142644012 [Castanea sativa]|uniref:uncharacterized protein LOC142644012 n=1 Tax=Castanea sativa TaxID=21020 RepID=UPI003F64C8E3